MEIKSWWIVWVVQIISAGTKFQLASNFVEFKLLLKSSLTFNFLTLTGKDDGFVCLQKSCDVKKKRKDSIDTTCFLSECTNVSGSRTFLTREQIFQVKQMLFHFYGSLFEFVVVDKHFKWVWNKWKCNHDITHTARVETLIIMQMQMLMNIIHTEMTGKWQKLP